MSGEGAGNGELTKYRVDQLEQTLHDLRKEHTSNTATILAALQELKMLVLTRYVTKEDLAELANRLRDLEDKENSFMVKLAKALAIALVGAAAAIIGTKGSP